MNYIDQRHAEWQASNCMARRDDDIIDNREAANSAFDDAQLWWLYEPPTKPRPRWLGLQAVSDVMLGIVALAVIVALCAAFYGRALVEFVRDVMR